MATGIREKLKNGIRTAVKTAGYKGLLPLVYRLCATQPRDEKLVLFADNRDREMPDNFVPLYRMCEEKGWRCEFLSGHAFHDNGPVWQRAGDRVRYYLRFMNRFAQCRTLFLCDYLAPADLVRPRGGTQVIQLWHACGLGKRWDYAIHENGIRTHRKEEDPFPKYVNQNLVCVSSNDKTLIEGYREAFDCQREIICPLGAPRTDLFFDPAFLSAAKNKVQQLFPSIGDRKIVLYAPTFRGNDIPTSYSPDELEFRSLAELLSEEYVFITKYHPLVNSRSRNAGERDFAFDGTELLTAAEALAAADILVTDYSSIFFEYLLLERPILSYVPDLEQYEAERGMFLPYEETAPGPYVYNQDELVQRLRTVHDWFDAERIRQYKNRFMSACDGHSTERIYHHVVGNSEEKSGGKN